MSNDSYSVLRKNKSEFIKYNRLTTLYGSLEFESIIFEMRMTYVATAHQVNLLIEANNELVEELTLFMNEH